MRRLILAAMLGLAISANVGCFIPIYSADPARSFFARQTGEQVSDAIASLGTEYRRIATLYFVESLKYREIADLLGCPIGTVRSRIHRARALLQVALRSCALDNGIGVEGSTVQTLEHAA